jgi:peptide/nickel transport system substrate-binding protein
MSDRRIDRLMQRPISRRQFLRYSAAAGIGVYVGAHGLQAWAQGTRGGQLTWLVHHEVAGLSPNHSGPTIQYAIIHNVLSPLVYVNHLTETEFVLARSVDTAADGLSYTFHLHEGARFHDDSEVTAEDVKYTYEFYAQPGNVIAGRFNAMRDVEVVDRYTVRVHMNRVDASFLRIAGETGIVPAAYHASIGEDAFAAAPIGAGAFRVSEWRPAEYTEIVAFPDHFRGAPNVDSIRFQVVPEPSVRFIAMLTGDAQGSVWSLSIDDALELEADPNFRSYRIPATSARQIFLNNTKPELSDRRVRQAMMFALDRERIRDDLERGLGIIASSHLPPHNIYFNPNVPQYPFDPERARSLLEEAGWSPGPDGIRRRDGARLSFTCTTLSGDQTRRPMAELGQIFLRDVGVEMLLAEAPLVTVQTGLLEGTLDASLFNWTHGNNADPNPIATLSSTGGNNYMRYRSEEMDRLIQEGVANADPELRRPVYDRTQELFAEDVPALLLHYGQGVMPISIEQGNLPDEVFNSDPFWVRGNEYTRG